MTKDSYQGKAYMGFTCAACHTTQLNYNNMGIRIDGAPAMANMVPYYSFQDWNELCQSTHNYFVN